jgi:hypothetical protein
MAAKNKKIYDFNDGQYGPETLAVINRGQIGQDFLFNTEHPDPYVFGVGFVVEMNTTLRSYKNTVLQLVSDARYKTHKLPAVQSSRGRKHWFPEPHSLDAIAVLDPREDVRISPKRAALTTWLPVADIRDAGRYTKYLRLSLFRNQVFDCENVLSTSKIRKRAQLAQMVEDPEADVDELDRRVKEVLADLP